MTARRHDITELELLALVEGGEGDDAALTPERHAALLADPMVVRLVAKLSADRAALAALPRLEPAPAGLVASAIDRAEREALAALAAAEPASPGEFRSSSIVEERPGALARLVQTRWPQRLAAAAGIALVAGGVYFIAAALVHWNATQPSRPGPIAINPPETPVETAPPVVPAPSPVEIAALPEAAPALPPSITVPNGPVDVATAVALVPEGRVVLVVRAADPRLAAATAGLAAQRRGGASLWQPMAADSPEFAATVAAALAGGFHLPPDLSGASVAFVGLRANTESFETLMAALRADSGSPQSSPQWAAVDAGLLQAAQGKAALLTLQPHRVLWWEQGSSAWSPLAVVPVVILPE